MYEDEPPKAEIELIRAIRCAIHYLDIMLNDPKFELTDYDEDNIGETLVFLDEYANNAV